MVITCAITISLRISSETINLIGWTVVTGLVIGLAGCFCLFTFISYEKYLSIQAERKKLQAEADEVTRRSQVLTHESQHGFFVSDLNPDATWQQLDRVPLWRINGHAQEPSALEMQTWLHYNAPASQHGVTPPPRLLSPMSQPLDLLRIFTQPLQSYAIIAGQQVGKTFQARRIAQHWLDSGVKPLVVGPKWDVNEWNGCVLFGGGYDFNRVAQGMRIVKRLAEERHADVTQSHKAQSLQPIFFDDWTAIRAKLEKEAEDFILDATTLYASVNIILYFIIHLDTANAWGVGKVGAALHQNFIKLMIEPGYDEAGLIDRRRNIGWLLMPGQHKKDRRQVQLFSGVGQSLLVIQPGEDVAKVEEERHILDLFDGGLTTPSAICQRLYGYRNAKKVELVRQILLDGGKLG